MANTMAAILKPKKRWFDGCRNLQLLAIESHALLAIKLQMRGDSIHLCHLRRFPLEPSPDSAEWLEIALQKLLQLPSPFRRNPCVFLAPHFAPILKFVEIPRVENEWRRKTLGQALEMELPVRGEDYLWDSIPVQENSQREGSYIFAERRRRLQPLFELLSSINILPESALLPLEAEFHQLAQWGNTLPDQGMQITINEDYLSLGSFGGQRPFLRYGNGGWNRLLEAVAAETQTSIIHLSSILDRWLARENLDNPTVESSFQKHGQEFFESIRQEMLRTELHYIRHLGGKSITLALISGSRPHLNRFGEWLKSQRKITVKGLDFGESFSFSRQSRREMAQLSSATRMHIYWAVQNSLCQSPSFPSPLIPEMLQQKLRRQQRQRFSHHLLLWISSILAIGCACRYGEIFRLQSALQEKTHRQAKLKVELREYQKIGDQLRQARNQWELSERIHWQQGHWLQFLNTLQRAIGIAEAAWLNDFQLIHSAQNGLPRLELRLRGNLLQRPEEELSRLQERLERFLQELEHSPLVLKMGELRIFPNKEYRLQFECILELAREKLLQ